MRAGPTNLLTRSRSRYPLASPATIPHDDDTSTISGCNRRVGADGQLSTNEPNVQHIILLAINQAARKTGVGLGAVRRICHWSMEIGRASLPPKSL